MEAILNLITEDPVRAIAGLVAACSALSALVPSGGKWMKVVDFCAINWMKARNDPKAQ